MREALNGLRLAAALVLVVLGLVPCAHSQCTDYSSYFHWDGFCSLPATGIDPERFGNHIIVTTAVGFQPRTGVDVIDISNPARPRYALHREVEFDSTRSTPAPDRIYLLPHNAVELWIVDMTDPLDPAVVGVVSSNARIGLVYHAPWLYVSFQVGGRYHGLQVFNLEDPRNPDFRLEMLNPVPLTRLVTDGQRLVARSMLGSTSGRGIRIFRLDDPGHPAVAGDYTGIDNIADIALKDSLVYMSLDTLGLRVLDITDPSSPQVLATLPVVCQRLWVMGDDRLLSRQSSSQMTLWSLGVPASPQVLATFSAPGPWDRGFLSGDRLLVPTDIRVVSLDTNLLTAGLAAPTDDLALGAAHDIAVHGRFAFTARPNLLILDVSNPYDLRSVGQFAIAANGEGVCVDGSLVYFALGSQGLLIADADVVDLQEPARRSWTLLGADVRAISVQGGLAVLTTSQSGLLLVDVSVPESPAVISTFPLPFPPLRVVLRYGMVFVLGSNGLQLVDVGDPDRPVLRGFVPTPSPAHGFQPSVGRCWIAEDAGLSRVDFSDPDHPLIDATWSTMTAARDVAVSGRWAFVAGGLPQVSVIDTERIGDPAVDGAVYFGGVPVERIVPCETGFLASTVNFSLGSILAIPPVCEPTALFASDLQAVASDEGVILSWTALPGGHAPGVVLRAADAWSEPAPLGNVPVLSGSRWVCTDTDVLPDTMYWYRVAHPRDPSVVSDPVTVRTPPRAARLELRAKTPNPFRERIELSFAVPAAGRARLAIYDVAGRLVLVLRDGESPAGRFVSPWDGRDARGKRVASGAYFAVLESGGRDARLKIVHLR